MNWIKLFSNNIRLIRESLHLSQAEMGEKLGFSESGYGDFERGESKIVSDVLLAMADYLEMSPLEILANGKIEDEGNGILRVSENESEKIKTLKEIYENKLAEKDEIIEDKSILIKSLTNDVKSLNKEVESLQKKIDSLKSQK